MEKLLKSVTVSSTDGAINTVISAAPAVADGYVTHFSQREEPFIALEQPLTVPSFKIHHDIENSVPDNEYIEVLRTLISTIHGAVPGVLNGLTYFFDPSEILRPCFYQLYKVEKSIYMYLLRLDLAYKPSDCTRLDTVANDLTPPFSSGKLFFEADFLPISNIERQDDTIISVSFDQIIQQVWIGESGRGYRVQGVWIDQDLTKFFTSLFTPDGISRYPYYPFSCKFRSFCHTPPAFTNDERKRLLPLFHRATDFIRPVAPQVEALMKRHSFSDDLSLLQELKSKIPKKWLETWNGLNVSVYLNEKEMREYSLEF